MRVNGTNGSYFGKRIQERAAGARAQPKWFYGPGHCVSLVTLVISTVLVVSVFAHPQGEKSEEAPVSGDKLQRFSVHSLGEVEERKFPWGWIRWLVNTKRDPQAEMTFGIVHINANQRNPLHIHSNCAEYLYVMSGSCQHRVGKEWVTLKEGDVIRVPKGVSHMARTLDEPMRAVIVYSSGDRKFEIVQE